MTQPDEEMWPMDDDDLLAARFEEHRAHLRAVAYRMLGSRAEAEDAVQETWLRLTRVDAATIDNLGGWLTTVVGRVCLNLLRSRRSRRDEPLGERVPDVVVTRDDATGPEHDAVEADSVGLALLVVLDTLAPAERLAFVLHDMFAVPFDDIAPIVERTPAATRQLASRARRRMRGATPVPDSDVTRQRRVVDAFFAASRQGDFDALVAVLDPDIVLRSDGGALLPAGTGLVRGAENVARQAIMFARASRSLVPVLVNGAAGVVVVIDGEPTSVMAFTVAGGRVVEIDVVVDPERLGRLDPALLQD
jgi:RNA polymerase sigma factor (sigma-70 family)